MDIPFKNNGVYANDIVIGEFVQNFVLSDAVKGNAGIDLLRERVNHLADSKELLGNDKFAGIDIGKHRHIFFVLRRQRIHGAEYGIRLFTP